MPSSSPRVRSADRRRVIVAAALAVSLAAGGVAVPGTSASEGTAVAELHYLMHSPVLVVARAGNEAAARAAVRSAFAAIRRLEEVLNTFDPESDASRLNRVAGGPAVAVAPELLGLLAEARILALETENAFSVLVGPLVALWRSAAESGHWPSPEALRTARRLARADVLEIRGSRVRLARAGSAIDLGGVAKGFAADRALSRLRDARAHAALVNLGGSSIAAFGDAGDGRPGWPVALPTIPHGDGEETEIRLVDAALSTSSTRGQSAIVDGRTVGHIIDPRSGEALTLDATAVVRHSSATVAEALSKAVLILGGDAGEVLARRGADALLLTDRGPAGCTPGFGRVAAGCSFPPTRRPATRPEEDEVRP